VGSEVGVTVGEGVRVGVGEEVGVGVKVKVGAGVEEAVSVALGGMAVGVGATATCVAHAIAARLKAQRASKKDFIERLLRRIW
jgi:hypothetical protein